MSFTYNVNTKIGKVRFWTQDTTESGALLSDEEIQMLLNEHGDDVRQSAASALLAIASNKALLAKRKKAGSYEEDTRTIAKELREQAQAILDGAVEPYDDVAEQTFGDPSDPYNGSSEKEFENREALRGDI